MTMRESTQIDPQGGNEMSAVTKIEIDPAKLTPCGYCRRCAIHDDPGGCLEVFAHEQELLASGVTPREILTVSWVGPAHLFEDAVRHFEWEAKQWWYTGEEPEPFVPSTSPWGNEGWGS